MHSGKSGKLVISRRVAFGAISRSSPASPCHTSTPISTATPTIAMWSVNAPIEADDTVSVPALGRRSTGITPIASSSGTSSGLRRRVV